MKQLNTESLTLTLTLTPTHTHEYTAKQKLNATCNLISFLRLRPAL